MSIEKVRNDWVYDIETYPNCFTFCAVYSTGKGLRVFEISDRKNESEQILDFLRKVVSNGHRMVGFNNLGFDYIIVHYMIEKARKCKIDGIPCKFTAKELYKQAQEIIDAMKSDSRFGKKIKESEIIIPQVDLYKIWHFDNKAKATSLKTLEFNMRSDNIEDLPFDVGTHLTSDEIDKLIEYNKHDVTQTLKFYKFSEEAIRLREELTELYGFDCTNFNDTKIGKELFIRSIEKEAPGSCYIQTERGRKIRQTKRDVIHLKNCLFPYIKFNRPEFGAVLEWFKQQSITETKGVFSDLPEHKLGEVAKYAAMVVKRKKFKSKPTDKEIEEFLKEYPLGWIEEEELKSTEYAFDEAGNHIMEYPVNEFGIEDRSKKPKKKRIPKKSYYGCWNLAETLNVVINGFRYDFGVGGLHGAKQGIIEPKEDEILFSYDVASYYPNMAIANNVYPEHLGLTFCKVYKDLYEQRKGHPKGSAPNAALKLALNGVYGDSGNEFSPLYDPQYTMTITVSGQMTLCMLIEKMINECNAEIIMCNTDGFEFIAKKDQEEKVQQLVSEWERITGLQMEGVKYEKMWVANVNNYISKSVDGKIKLKGAFEYADYRKLGWHKNHSAMVIAKAVEAYFVKGEDYEEFIRLHDDKYDFMLRTKVPRNSKLMLKTEDDMIEQQNTCRYYPVKSGGGKLIKVMPELEQGSGEREIGIDADWNVKICNDISNFTWEDLEYNYYVSEAKKLIDSVEKVT